MPGFRGAWLGLIQWLNGRKLLPLRLRDMLMWDVATYVLGYGFETPVTLTTGPTLVAGIDDEVNRQVLFFPQWDDYIWEPQTSRLALHLQPPNKATFLAGGHIGYHALHLAWAAKQNGGQVFAFEPLAKSFGRLKRGQELSHLTNLTCERAILTRESCEEVSFFAAGTVSSVDARVANSAVEERVRAVALDDYAQAQGIEKVGLIFLDVEGNELEVLRGAPGLLAQEPDLILEVNRPGLKAQGLTEGDFYQFLFERGYQVFYIEDNYSFTLSGYDRNCVELRPVRGEDRTFKPGMPSFNIVATRHLERLTAPFIRIQSDQTIGATV